MKRLNLVLIETVCAVAHLGTYTAASKKLNTTQSTVSARMRELEATVGVKLFQRHGRNVELTLDGREFVRAAEPMLLEMEDLLNGFDGARFAAGRIRIGVGNICMSWFPKFIVELRKSMPDLLFDLEIGMAAPLLRNLEQGKIDLAVITGLSGFNNLTVESLGFQSMHWLASSQLEKQVHGCDIQGILDRLPLWCIPRPSFYFNAALASLRSHGASVRHLNTSDNMAATLELVMGGAGIGLLAEDMAMQYVASGNLVPIFGSIRPPPLEFFIACHPDRRYALLEKVMHMAVSASRMPRVATPSF